MIFLRDIARLLVVVRNGRVLVPQIHLDDLLHVFVQVRELLLDLPGLRPDAAVDDLRFVVGQMHHARKILPQPHRVHDREVQPPRRRDGQQPQNHVVQRANHVLAP